MSGRSYIDKDENDLPSLFIVYLTLLGGAG